MYTMKALLIYFIKPLGKSVFIAVLELIENFRSTVVTITNLN